VISDPKAYGSPEQFRSIRVTALPILAR